MQGQLISADDLPDYLPYDMCSYYVGPVFTDGTYDCGNGTWYPPASQCCPRGATTCVTGVPRCRVLVANYPDYDPGVNEAAVLSSGLPIQIFYGTFTTQKDFYAYSYEEHKPMLFYQWGARPQPHAHPARRRGADAHPPTPSTPPSATRCRHPLGAEPEAFVAKDRFIRLDLAPPYYCDCEYRVSANYTNLNLGNVTACDFPANKLEKYASTTSIYGQPLEEAEPNAWDFALKYSPDFLQMCAASRDAPPSAFRLPLNSRMWQCQDARLS